MKATSRDSTLAMRCQLPTQQKARFQIRFACADDLTMFLFELAGKYGIRAGDDTVSVDQSQANPVVSFGHSQMQQQQQYRRAEPGNLQSVMDVSETMLSQPVFGAMGQRGTASMCVDQESLIESMDFDMSASSKQGADDLSSLLPDMESEEGIDFWIDEMLADPTFPAFVERVERVWAKKFLADVL